MNKQERINAYLNFFKSSTKKQYGGNMPVFKGYPLGYKGPQKQRGGSGLGGLLEGSYKVFLPIIMKLVKFMSNKKSKKTIDGVKHELKKALIDNAIPAITKQLSTVPKKIIKQVKKKFDKKQTRKNINNKNTTNTTTNKEQSGGKYKHKTNNKKIQNRNTEKYKHKTNKKHTKKQITKKNNTKNKIKKYNKDIYDTIL